jgi:predicted dehydrogenase
VGEQLRIRVGVVGVGDWGGRHAAIAAALPEFEFVAVADQNAQRAEAVASQYGVEAFADANALLSGCDVDAIVIATPPAGHLRDICSALGSGVHALVEKPVVVDRYEAERLRTLAASASTVLMPAHVSRFMPSFAALRQAVAGQRVIAVRAVRRVPMARLDLHGGEHPALVAMVHDLDLVRAFVPAALESVESVQRWVDDSRPYPQIVMAHLRFADGVVASVENHWTLPHERQYIDAHLEVSTDRTIAHLEVPGTALRLTTADGDFLPDTQLEAWVAGIPVGALATQMRHFASCIRSGRPSQVVTVDEALWSVDVAARIAAQCQR